MEELLKPVMTLYELAEAFVSEYPWLVPNGTNVECYAEMKGYTRVQQTVNRETIVKYVKKNG